VRPSRAIRGNKVLAIGGLICMCAAALFSRSEPGPVNVQAEIVGTSGPKAETRKGKEDASNVVIWLIPLAQPPRATHVAPSQPGPRIVQANKSFWPHVIVVQLGTEVQFPNHDPFLHNVFSFFDGKRFDLGFYEAGSSKSVRFDRVGVSYLFCNIHPNMSGAVVTVDTPYFGISNRSGQISIANVPEGRYELNVWYERSLPEALKAASRIVTITTADRNLDPIHVAENPNFTPEHKNKYGQDYLPPASSSPLYGNP
jgi:plastocyanin